MEKLPISVGILSWNSGQVLVNTLKTYFENGLVNVVDDITILFQEFSEQDKRIADHFGIPYIPKNDNIGIGKGFIELAEHSKNDYILLLEHDWKLIENQSEVDSQLSRGIQFLDDGYHSIRYRHRSNPGHPHFSFKHKGNELTYYDKEIEATSPHLLDSIHWCDPSVEFPDKIQKSNEFFITTSEWGNWTNNPCLYKTDFYIKTVYPFVGNGVDLEGNISKWWNRQNYRVAHSEGLFTHIDENKYRR